MIYLFAGDDTENKIKNYENFLNKVPDSVPIFSFNRNNFRAMDIESFYSNSSLFEKKSVILFSNILEWKDHCDFLLNNLDSMEESINSFVFIENKLLKPVIKKFEKVGAKISISELKKEQKEIFNNFLLADAFFQKDKIKLWIYYRQAVDLGVSLEELIGVLFWKIKDMIVKKRFFKFKEEELKEIAFELSHLLPKARNNKRDAEVVFEKLLLEIT
jgi:hypothetical protein